ncbi:hypothetical protein STANM309S_03658 [Streptomyces tanashiensis]
MTTVLLSVTIMTHPARSAMASNLVGLLGGEAKVVMDPDPGGVPNASAYERRSMDGI